MPVRRIGIVAIYGSTKNIEAAEAALSTIVLPGNEEHDREVLQSLIHAERLSANILYAGNSVWDANLLVKNMKTMVKHDSVKRMSNYMYKFLSLACGSIAHFDKAGWINTYPTVDDLRRFFKHNEFGQPVSRHIPNWQWDAKNAVKQIEEVLS